MVVDKMSADIAMDILMRMLNNARIEADQAASRHVRMNTERFDDHRAKFILGSLKKHKALICQIFEALQDDDSERAKNARDVCIKALKS